MKHREKRIVSLLLSGVMLLSNLPLSALAEEVVEEETVVITGQAPAASRSVIQENTDQQEACETVTYPVKVDGEWLTSDMDDADVSYDPDSGMLTLCGARLESLMLTESMTLALKGSNTIEAEEGLALLAEEDLTLTGTGALTVTGNDSTVMEVKGRTQGEAQFGLTVEESVTLAVTALAEKAPIALTSPKGITLGEGSHVKFSHTTFGETVAFGGSGYCKIGNGSFAAAEDSWTSDGSGVEFVGVAHVQWVKTDTGHYKTCIDPNCPLATGLELEAGNHDTIRDANCQSPAECGICGAYGSKDPTVHTQEAAYASDEDEHWQAYACCGAEVEGTRQIHEMAFSVEENKISNRCTLCRQGKDIELQPKAGESYVYDGAPKEVVAVNGIDDRVLTVGYRDPAGAELQEPPTEAGAYTAWVCYQDLEAKLMFEIKPMPLTEDMVTLTPESALFGQLAECPQIQIADGVTCEILYSRGDRQTDDPAKIDWVNAGNVTITVTGTGNYTGTLTRTYTIRQEKPTADMFQFAAPENLTYNGETKATTLTPLVEGMGSFEVCYSNDPIHAGTYKVSVQVAGDSNYEKATLTDEGWCFTITPTADYTDKSQSKQVIGKGLKDIQLPFSTGAAGETVEGTCDYTLNGENVANENTLLARLGELKDGASVTVGYTFTPKGNGNYTGTKSGTIQVTKAVLTFTMDSGEAVTLDAIRKEAVTYGTDPLVDVSKIKATLADAVDEEDSHFTVEYTTQDGQTVAATGALDVGAYAFTVSYSNSDLGGYAIEKTQVISGWIRVTTQKLTISEENKPKGGYIIQEQNGSAQPLLAKDNAGQTDNGLKLEYSLSQYGEYSAEIPEASEPGAYTVWYRAPKSGNYDTVNAEGSVNVVIFPCLKATYGDMLEDIKLPDGFALNGDNPGADSAGDVGEYKVKLDYARKSLRGIEVPLIVSPKEITVSFAILERYKYLTYNKDTPARAKIGEVRNVTEDCILPADAYTLQYENDDGRGEAKVWPVSTGNYAFTAEPQSYYIYDPVAAVLTDNVKLPNAVKQAGYDSGKAIREKLDSQFSKEYPASRRKFTCFLLKTGDGTYDYLENGWPDKGIAMKINYPTGTDGKDSFKVYAMYLVDCGDIKAGTIVEMKQAKDTLGMCEYSCYDNQICLKMPTYMAVAIGAEAEKYTLKRNSSTRGTITFTIGEDTTALTSAKVRVGETVTVQVTDIQEKYGVTMVEYYETALGYKSSSPVKASENADGTYSFTMPEHDTTIKVTIRKSSGNPRTGDVIRFWAGLLVISGAGVVSLLLWRRKKRK